MTILQMIIGNGAELDRTESQKNAHWAPGARSQEGIMQRITFGIADGPPAQSVPRGDQSGLS